MEYYPLKFKPIIKERIWGGEKLSALFGKPAIEGPAGESWELSGVSGDISVVENGSLKGKLLTDLIEDDPNGILGEEVVNRFGREFPILIKFIDARTDLSIQVHPDDTLATKRHGSMGKTEMWYIMDADPGSRLVLGFKEAIDESHYTDHLNNKTLFDILHEQPVQRGEVYFIEAGTVHAIGGGIVLAEIQQTSDVTYRVYDYDRVGADGQGRELHTELALEAMHLGPAEGVHIDFTRDMNRSNTIVNSPYFITRFLPVSGRVGLDLKKRQAFTILMCVGGKATVSAGTGSVVLSQGMTALLPAVMDHTEIAGEGELLEITL